MKKHLLVAIALLSGALAFAQGGTNTPVSRSYSAEEIAAMGSEKVDFLNFVGSRGYMINDMTGKDLSGYPDISELKPRKDGVQPLSAETFDAATFNLLDYNFELLEGTPLIYRIGSSEKALFIHSEVRMNALYGRNGTNTKAGK